MGGRPSGQFVHTCIGHRSDSRERGLVGGLNRFQRRRMADAFGFRSLGVGMLGGFARRCQALFADGTRGRNPPVAILVGRSNEILETLLHG